MGKTAKVKEVPEKTNGIKYESSEVVRELTQDFDDMKEMELFIPQKLSKEISRLADGMNDQEARYLIEVYNQMQEYRMRLAAQVRELEKNGSQFAMLQYFLDTFSTTEKQIKKCLQIYTETHPVGRWLNSLTGVGPIISASLIAYIDLDRCPTSSHIMSYAGMQPNSSWGKGEKRPWNAEFKSMLYNAACCFVRNKNRGSMYGKLFDQRKAYETLRNEQGLYADQAAKALLKLKDKNTPTYKRNLEGKLSDAHIVSRAQRHILKIFISHVHYVMHRSKHGTEPRKPYVFDYLEHDTMIYPQNLEVMGWKTFYGTPLEELYKSKAFIVNKPTPIKETVVEETPTYSYKMDGCSNLGEIVKNAEKKNK